MTIEWTTEVGVTYGNGRIADHDVKCTISPVEVDLWKAVIEIDEGGPFSVKPDNETLEAAQQWCLETVGGLIKPYVVITQVPVVVMAATRHGAVGRTTKAIQELLCGHPGFGSVVISTFSGAPLERGERIFENVRNVIPLGADLPCQKLL